MKTLTGFYYVSRNGKLHPHAADALSSDIDAVTVGKTQDIRDAMRALLYNQGKDARAMVDHANNLIDEEFERIRAMRSVIADLKDWRNVE